MSQAGPAAPFITFYSFKGGVGRSMALINTAGILAGRGFHVLVIDLDLEAPGLSYLDPAAPALPDPSDLSVPWTEPVHRLHLGFVDLLSDAKQRGKDADLFTLDPKDLAERYTQAYRLPEELQAEGGSVHIMPAGKLDDSYARRFDALNLRGLYQEGLGEPLIRAFKKTFAECGVYDYVLVDSRTGFSDEAGICTRDLADYLMILSGLNRQNVEGTAEFLKALRAATLGKAPTFDIILSPVPNGEDALLDDREEKAKAAFQNAWQHEVELELQIPYHPQLALTEEPHIFRRRRGYLFEAYRDVERRLLEAIGHDAPAVYGQVQRALDQRDYPSALTALRRLVRLDKGRQTLTNFASLITQRQWQTKGEDVVPKETVTLDKLLRDDNGRTIVEFVVNNLDEREPSLGGFLWWLMKADVDLADRLYQRLVDARPHDASTLLGYAHFLADGHRDAERAEEYYRRAVDTLPKWVAPIRVLATFLWHVRGNPDAAEGFYKRAIEVDPQDQASLVLYARFLTDQRGDLDAAEGLYERAIEVDPGDVASLVLCAIFFADQRGNLDAAEAYFKRAIQTNPKDSRSLRLYATFLGRHRRNLDAAEAWYRKALDVDPDDATKSEFGQFLAGCGRFQEAEEMLRSATKHPEQFGASKTAELYFSLWLVSRVRQRDEKSWEAGFKYLLQKGFKRFRSTFDHMLEQAAKVLPPEDMDYAKALAAAFLDERKMKHLDKYERWQTLEARDPGR
ncbi:MAG TPA: tetratricopeptide repeat protein [Polyangiaceae bacterium]